MATDGPTVTVIPGWMSHSSFPAERGRVVAAADAVLVVVVAGQAQVMVVEPEAEPIREATTVPSPAPGKM